jgi:hydrogenase expression/formation protein HypC
MCLSIPAKVINIKGNMADVSLGGTMLSAGIQMVENVEVGDYILLHAGFAIQKISEDDAMETLRLINEMKDVLKD